MSARGQFTYGGVTYGVTPQGFVLPSVAVLIAATKGDLLGLINPDTDLSDDQPPGQIIGVLCKKVGEVWQLGQVAYNATNRADAEGDLLDNIGSLTGTEREGQTPSAVQCTANFSVAGTYAAGALVAFLAPPASGSIQFANAEAVVVPATGGDGVNGISTTNTWPSLSGDGGTITLSGGNMTLTGTGSTTIPASLIGQNITIAGGATAANNGTFPITSRTGATITWAAPAGAATDANAGVIVWVADPLPFLFESVEDGPSYGEALVAANQAQGGGYGQLSKMTPVAGWVNVADAGGVTLGTLEEIDTPYRVRQYEELSAPGNDTLDATKAAILEGLQNAPLPVVGETVTMYENTKLTGDPATGLPGKSYMAVVYDGSNSGLFSQNDAIIGQAIWNNKPGGMQTYGLTAVPVTDADGNPQVVFFTRATDVPFYLAFTVSVSAAVMGNPAQQTALQLAIVAALVNATQGQPFTMYGTTVVPGLGAETTLAPGQDVVAGVLRGIAQGQSGALDVPSATFFLGLTMAPVTTANLVYGIGQYPTLPSGNISITFQLFTG